MATDTISGTNTLLNQYGTVKQTPNTDSIKKADTDTSDAGKTQTALKGLGDNFDQFLKLLTTQMQNQDPLKPMDTNEMTNQLVQFANVEQNIATNSRLDKLVKLQENYTTSGNLFYLNRSVEYKGDTFQYAEGMTSIELGYELEKSAKSVRVDILDSQGRLVSSTKGDTKSGSKHSFVWDFKDDQGRAVQPGSYRINVAPTSETKDETIKTTTYTKGVVTGIDYSKTGETVLKTNNGVNVEIPDVVSVS